MAPSQAARAADELLFYVNGRRVVEKNADPEQMLLPYLRKGLRLTGTKYGCGGGGCGACTVMISRYEPISKKIVHYSANACLIPICSLYGAAVVTVEGIGNTKTRIHPVQERIAKSHGSQCGFCTPGMVMSIYALLRNETEPRSEQITEALAGNLCRCTGYRPIIDGCKTFSKESFCCQNKENGGCCANQEECFPLHPNKEKKLSTALFSAEEFQPLDPTQELIFPPELIVTCVGQIVCAVVADSAARAKRAAAKVKITYKALEPIVLTIEDAIKHRSFFSPERKLEQGNVQEGFDMADHILEGEVHIGGQEHFYMETQSVLVIPKGEDKEMDIYVSAQHPTFTQELVASVLNIPSNRIMCHVKRVGGGFGGKITKAAILAAVTAVAANKTGCAIRCILDRADDMLITGGRHPFLGKYKVGFMNDGRIVALCVKYYSNAGCTADESIAVMENGLLRMDNAYKIPNLLCQGCVCKTHLPSNTAFRGFGFPQSALVTEIVITDVANQTGLPQEEVRERNMYKTFDETHYKQEIDAGNMIRCWKECMQKSCFHKRKLEAEEFNKHNYWRKKGIAIIPLKYSVGLHPMYLNQAAALVHVYLDGHVLVTHGGVELGQGIHTKMIQIASRELRIPTSYIYISETSTATVPNTRPTAASIGTDINGMAVKNACETLMKRLKPVMDENPEGTWKDWISEAFRQSISLSATGYFRGYKTHMDWEKGEGRPYEYCVFGAACSEVEVDCLTGDHKNIRTDIVMDVGCSINPAIDIGQIEGAFVQGLGLYTMEVLKYSPEGILKAYGPNQYKIPALCDIPEQFYVSLLSSSQNTSAIYSSKAIGEPALFLGSSVFFAIKDAIAAAREERGSPRIFTLNSPATPEHIRMACMDQFTEMVSKNKPDSGNPCATPS